MIAAMSMRRFDLPLETVAASRFLPWIIAALIYLAVVALAVAAVAERAYELYNMRARLVTVTLPSVDGGGEQQIEAALDILRQTRGVTSASRVPEDELARLIEPWLGAGQANRDLPLPRLIDVTLDPAAKPDLRPCRTGWRRWCPAPASAPKPSRAIAPSAWPRSFGRGQAGRACSCCSARWRSSP